MHFFSSWLFQIIKELIDFTTESLRDLLQGQDLNGTKPEELTIPVPLCLSRFSSEQETGEFPQLVLKAQDTSFLYLFLALQCK